MFGVDRTVWVWLTKGEREGSNRCMRAGGSPKLDKAPQSNNERSPMATLSLRPYLLCATQRVDSQLRFSSPIEPLKGECGGKVRDFPIPNRSTVCKLKADSFGTAWRHLETPRELPLARGVFQVSRGSCGLDWPRTEREGCRVPPFSTASLWSMAPSLFLRTANRLRFHRAPAVRHLFPGFAAVRGFASGHKDRIAVIGSGNWGSVAGGFTQADNYFMPNPPRRRRRRLPGDPFVSGLSWLRLRSPEGHHTDMFPHRAPVPYWPALTPASSPHRGPERPQAR